jgi:predicted short-subunit dehydrogenase-like oxidoreductase (DUF2520 family)
MLMDTLNIIGCGRLGQTLAKLWSQQAVFTIQDVMNRTIESAAAAVAFIGAGRAVTDAADLRPADLFLIATPDDAIATCAHRLTQAGCLQPGNIVFHCSGALPSTDLNMVTACGAFVASVHPVKSFATPGRAVRSFAGTYCGVEGDPDALAVLQLAFTRIGGKLFTIDATQKTFYHAAAVLVCNDLTALLELGARLYEKAGLSRQTAFDVMQPIVRETVEAAFTLGTARALTGPVARGDYTTVAKQLNALHAWNPQIEDAYRALGAIALDLAKAQGIADEAALAHLQKLLDRSAS